MGSAVRTGAEPGSATELPARLAEVPGPLADLRVLLFQCIGHLGGEGAPRLPLFIGEYVERILAGGRVDLGRSLATGLGELDEEGPAVVLIALPGDQARGLQLGDQFAEGLGADAEHVGEVLLGERGLQGEDAEHSALAGADLPTEAAASAASAVPPTSAAAIVSPVSFVLLHGAVAAASLPVGGAHEYEQPGGEFGRVSGGVFSGTSGVPGGVVDVSHDLSLSCVGT